MEPIDTSGMATRPVSLDSLTHQRDTGHGTVYITLTYPAKEVLNEGLTYWVVDYAHPIEVFIAISKAEPCTKAWAEGIARLASLALRRGSNPQEVAKQLNAINCGHVLVGQSQSVMDTLAKVLMEVSDERETSSHD
jgi:hypothetical protein